MKYNALTHSLPLIKARYFLYILALLAGFIAPLGFAPFHTPGLLFLSLAIFFSLLLQANSKQSLLIGFIFGLGFFGLGVSWVIFSIHDYGQLNYFLSSLVTLVFILYLSLFPAGVAYFFVCLKQENKPLISMAIFAALWCIGEYLRSHLMTGFPWILLGTAQIDTPLKYLAPLFGIYGLSFFTVLASACLAYSIKASSFKRSLYLSAFVLIIITPALLKPVSWVQEDSESITVGAIQGNLSMRDKWDEKLFWKLLKYYKESTDKLLGKQLIILPESAIPLPARYLPEYLNRLDEKTFKAKSALLLGILHPADDNETHFYNAINTYGHASGRHLKQQLVPFGEYIPEPFVALNHWFGLPEPHITPGKENQSLIRIFNHPVASLICYEIAYPKLLRRQLPEAHWIVSISDNGWFGHSFASYQQLQMSQILSLMTGRYQIVVNNDGLSSVIDTQGTILDSLAPFSEGLLKSIVFPAHGTTPWVLWGDWPVLGACLGFILMCIFFKSLSRCSKYSFSIKFSIAAKLKRRYP